ncbi:VOC family protein [Natronosalvus halobius]|uniref:VOC family protein n=1 Tax=Natronosalvus halobius TaxID=2953746 RepID=UPI00209F36CB|nr:VOC family protein [Natronosalvus halobius]USZ72959.1 VOC family protein [Natronosalvus halobius]
MSGIVFFGTESLEPIVDFYVEDIGAERWLKQPDCTILTYDNLLLGFCARESAETDGTITFVFDTANEVDAMYDRLAGRALGEPVENDRYRIYQFFAEDPEGRTLEFQTFRHETDSL